MAFFIIEVNIHLTVLILGRSFFLIYIVSNLTWREQLHRNRLLEILYDYDFVTTVGVIDGRKYVGIVSCLIDGISSDNAGSIFNSKGVAVRAGLQCAPRAHKRIGTFPAGTVRFSVGPFTDEKDYDELVAALDYIAENM